MKKLTGYILINELTDILLILNEKGDVVWIPQRPGWPVSVGRRKRESIEAWIAGRGTLKVLFDPHE